MKTTKIKKVFALALMVLTVGYAYAFNSDLKFTDSKKVTVRLGNDLESAIISIKDLNGISFYSEKVKKSQKEYIRTFDLTALPNGTYVVEIEGDVKVVAYDIFVAEDKISSTIGDKKITFKPLVYVRNNRVFVTKFNPELAPLNITIFNSKDEVVYAETLEAKDMLGRIYDFSNSKGDYKIAMSNNEETYYQTVSVK